MVKKLLWTLLPLLPLLALVVGVLVFTAAFTLVERKLMGLHQRREGPDRVGFEGLGQPFADGLKLLRKETLLPKDSPERQVFFLAPLLSLWVSLLLWTLVPLSPAGAFVAEELGLLLVLGLSALGSYGVIYAGWASNNKYALLGAFRAVAQFISYEIIFSLLFLPLIGVTGGANLQNLVDYQVQEGWFSYLVPLWGLSFLVILAETNRTPFDLPEAEAELVAGFNVEYSSLLFAFFFLAEYSAMGFFGVLLVTLFFGGYSLMPLGWGWDGDRPLDAFSAYWRLVQHTDMTSVLGGTRCYFTTDGDNFCELPPRQPAAGYRRSWPMTNELDPHDTESPLLIAQQHRRPRLQQLAPPTRQAQLHLNFVEQWRGSMNDFEPPWVPIVNFTNYPSPVDYLFRGLHPVRPLPQAFPLLELNPELLTVCALWDAALLNPVDCRDTPLWAVLMPGLTAVLVLALKVQLLCAAFIGVRASLPRLRFDQLTLLCWKYLFPLVLGGSLLVCGLHYGFTIYYLAVETRTFGLFWLPHYYFMKDSFFGADLPDSKNQGIHGLVQLRHSTAALDMWGLKNQWADWDGERALQRRWGGWDPGRLWHFWTTQPTDWMAEIRDQYAGPGRVVPPLPSDHPQWEAAQVEIAANFGID